MTLNKSHDSGILKSNIDYMHTMAIAYGGIYASLALVMDYDIKYNKRKIIYDTGKDK